MSSTSSSTQTSRWLPYDVASAWYRAEGVTTYAELTARAKQGLPQGIPANPRGAYPYEFKNGGMGRFLGTGRIAVFNRKWVSYEEASIWYQAEGVTTQAELRDRAKQGLPPGIPSNPWAAYSEEFKDGGIGRFLGTGRIANQNRIWVSYEDASTWYQNEGVTTKAELIARAKLGLPPGIPASPPAVYPKEFKNGGWGRFLGTGRIASFNREWVSYEEASIWYQAEGVTCHAELQARAKQGLPPGIPADPRGAYPEEFKKGGLTAFLNLKKMIGTSKIERALRHVLENLFLEPASQMVRLRVPGASGQVWHVDTALHRVGLIVEYDGCHWHRSPKSIVTDIRKTKDLTKAGWTVVRLRGQYANYRLPLINSNLDMALPENLSIHDQISEVITHLKKLYVQGHLKLSRSDQTRLMSWGPQDIKNFNFREVLTSYDGLVSYKEASAWYQAEGITTWDELRARAKNGLPPGIPSNPYKAYPEEFKTGGLGRFLGTGRIAVFNREWVSYEEASAWYKAEGVTTQSELVARAKKGLPPGIPADPRRAYLNEFRNGGWGRFLGTGRIAVFNRVWLPYEEAAAWCQAEGIRTWNELRVRAKNGLLHPGIPTNPYQVYPDEFKNGGIRRFLGTEIVNTKAELIVSVQDGLPQGILAPKLLPEDKSTGAQNIHPHSIPQLISPSPTSPTPARRSRRMY